MFTANDIFISGALELNRHAFDSSRGENQASHVDALSNIANMIDEQVPDDVAQYPQQIPEQPQTPAGRTKTKLFIQIKLFIAASVLIVSLVKSVL